MKDITTLDNPGFGTTVAGVQVLATDDVSYDPDIYLQPAPNIGFKYLSPTGDLYKRPGSP
jgi:hypothetical protein